MLVGLMTKTNKQLAEEQEKRFASLVGGEVVRGSGSGWRYKADVLTLVWLFEMKRTSSRSITVKLDDWDKLIAEAAMEDRIPAMHIELGHRRFVVLPEDDFLILTDVDT